MKKLDYIIIIILLVFVGFALIYTNKTYNPEENRYVKVTVDGNEIKRIYFDGASKKIHTIETEYGKNVLELEDYKVRVIEASCPDKLDVKQGYIKHSGEVIVCLPNRMLVEIISDEIDDKIDIVN